MNKRYPRGAILFSILAMALVILVSNKLVQYPVQGFLFGRDMSLVLTWGAFTYPVAFFVTDTTNRLFGAGPAAAGGELRGAAAKRTERGDGSPLPLDNAAGPGGHRRDPRL